MRINVIAIGDLYAGQSYVLGSEERELLQLSKIARLAPEVEQNYAYGTDCGRIGFKLMN